MAMPIPPATPEPHPKPSGVHGHVCSRCGHWDDHCGPSVNAGGQIVIDLAGLPASISLISRLHRLKRELEQDRPPRTSAEVAVELGKIIADYEVRK